MQIIIESKDELSPAHNKMLDIAQAVFDLIEEGKVKVDISLITITDKQFRALHLWFRRCEKALNEANIPCYGRLSAKPGRWYEGDFKGGVYIPFLRAYKGICSTKDQGTKTPDECLKALSGHIASEYGATLAE